MEIETAKAKIRKFYEDRKTMPSYSEMAKLLGYKSKNSVYRLVEKLLDDGFVGKDARGSLVPGKGFGTVRMLGFVEAGFPTAAEEELLDTVDVDRLLIGNRERMFMLTVSGESMIDEGINDGDFILVERTAEAKDGDIVVAFIDGGYTVKFLRKKNGRAYLQPANKNFPPIVPREDDELRICAVVRAVIRKY
ncbi:MAG TPA: transcriptional repressor LexA [Candidatus Paceibacterota bacterium]|jgi:repressor LexA|nr:transcriptional repressor LexA [Candidatus Paceibacterota bacterium]